MSTHDPQPNPATVDELRLRGWAAEGLAALQRYLANHAAFAAYLAARDATGDGASRA